MSYHPHRKTDDIYHIVAGRQREILAALGIKWNPAHPRQHIRCPYPGHTDTHPSWRWDHDKGMAHCTCCHTNILGVVERVRGCDWRAARDFCRKALHADPWQPASSERPMPDHLHVVPDESSANETKAPPPWQRPIAATFDYADEHGEVLFQSVKFADSLEPRFMQRHPDGQGGWKWRLDGSRRILYRLPELVAAVADKQTIYIAEGEKDVENLRGLGLVATTNPMGAGKWRPEYSETLRSADVVIIGDNDDPGSRHVEQVSAALHGIAKRVRVLDLAKHWPQCPHKGDISDWVAAGGTADELTAVVDAAPEWNAPGDISSGDNWPVMDAAAYYGLAGDVVRIIEPHGPRWCHERRTKGNILRPRASSDGVGGCGLEPISGAKRTGIGRGPHSPRPRSSFQAQGR
jgi:5S rRNA maturation endonuclease (ribonuclease M5)